MLYLFLGILIGISLCNASNKEKNNCQEEGQCHGLIIVDVQNDFMLVPEREKSPTQGKLSAFSTKNPLKGSPGPDNVPQNWKRPEPNQFKDDTLKYIKQSLEGDKYDFIVYSIDYHPNGHCSFNTINPPKGQERCNKKGQIAWPEHCIQGSQGAKLVKGMPYPNLINRVYVIPTYHKTDPTQEVALTNLRQVLGYSILAELDTQLSRTALKGENPNFEIPRNFRHNSKPWSEFLGSVFDGELTKVHNKKAVDVFFIFKGMNFGVDSYSAFYGNNGETSKTPLHDTLEQAGYKPFITTIDTLGVAYDYCVKFTALDAEQLHYNVNFLGKYSAPIFDYDGTDKQLLETHVNITEKVNKQEAKETEPQRRRRLLSKKRRKKLNKIKSKLSKDIWPD